MKKIYVFALAAALMLTGCSSVSVNSQPEIPEDLETVEQVVSDDVAEVPEDYATVEATAESDTETEDEIVDAPDVTLVPGVWTWDIDGIPAGYYLINDDGLSGSTLPYDTGVSVNFNVEIGINEITFHYDDDSGSVLYQIVGGDPSYIQMRVDDASPLYVIQYINDGTAADLEGVFFTDDELIKMAAAYYEKQTGETAADTGCQVNEDNTVTIILNGGAAQYTVDRHNAEGFDDISGEPIMIIPVE